MARALMFTLGVALALLGLAVALAVWATGVRFDTQQEHNDHAT